MTTITPQAGEHDFDGACAPRPPFGSNLTFSVGVFEYVEKRSVGLKRGKVKVRVKGPTSDPERVFAKAREIVEQLDAGTYTGPKNVSV